MVFQKKSDDNTAPKVLKTKNRFKVVVTYEHDTQPTATFRTEYAATSPKSATVRAARWANQNRPHKRQFRSWVIVVENISAPDPEQEG